MTITAAADGSALGNPGPAGWAWYVDDTCWAAGGWKHATNNQGELKAVLELFRATAHLDEDLLVLCDSQYVINCVTKWLPGWKRKGWRKADGKPVLNVEMLKEIDEAIAGRQYRFEWVRGHVGHVLNEAADVRARAVAEAYQRGGAVPTGPGWTGETGAGTAAAAPETPAAAPPLTPATAATDASAAVSSAAEDSALGEPADVAVDDTLFSFEDTEWHTLSLSITDEEHHRLVRRARDRGVSVEDLLRSLI